MSEYTSAPWCIVKDYGRTEIGGSGCIPFQVCIVSEGSGAEANADLISAAPDMYEALDWMLHVSNGVSKGGGIPSPQEYADAFDAGETALKKAQGGEE